MTYDRGELLLRFYSILGRFEREIGGTRRLADCSGRMIWPKRGVYFFQQTGEARTDTGAGPRIVRVGKGKPRPPNAGRKKGSRYKATERIRKLSEPLQDGA